MSGADFSRCKYIDGEENIIIANTRRLTNGGSMLC